MNWTRFPRVRVTQTPTLLEFLPNQILSNKLIF